MKFGKSIVIVRSAYLSHEIIVIQECNFNNKMNVQIKIMKEKLLLMVVMIASSGLCLQLSAQSASTEKWSTQKTKKWFNKKEWLNGAAVVPHDAINKTEFA
jgi:hypothetical protein